MDLQNLTTETEVWLTIKAPDGADFIGADGSAWQIKLAGPTHQRGFRAEEAIRGRMWREARAYGTDTTDEERAEKYISDVLEPMVIRTLDWKPVLWGGEPFPCTPENATTLYRGSDTVRRQVDAFLSRASNFLKKP